MALCLHHVWLFSFINSHFSPRNSILSVFSIFVCCTLWFVTHNKRAERTVDISTFLQTDWNLYSRRQSCNQGFLWALCKKSHVWCFKASDKLTLTLGWNDSLEEDRGMKFFFRERHFHGGDYGSTASTSCSPCPIYLTVFLRYEPSQIDSVSWDKQLIFLLYLSLISYVFYIHSIEFHRSYLMHFKEMYRCMLGRNLMDWPVLLHFAGSLSDIDSLFALTRQVSYYTQMTD